MTEKLIYLDYQSTTPCDQRVLDTMIPYFINNFGNPHSIHEFGWQAEQAVENAREKIASLIHAKDNDIIFTSGATESNNLAITGILSFFNTHSVKRNHVITVKTEHKCVLECCRHMESLGFLVTYLPVSKDGLIDLHELEQAITNETLLVSIMAVNNEIGVIQPLYEIGKICKKHSVFFHTDAAQALGKINLDVDAMHIDLMSMSAHKIYGPKGIGALYVRRKNPRVRLTPLIFGGGQERGMRPGTLPVPLCVGFGKACEILSQEMHTENKRIQELSDLLKENITRNIPHVYLNGHSEKRIPGNLNFSFAFVEGESLMGLMPNIAISTGSACTSASLEPSYVLNALGVDCDLAHSSLRFSIGRYTTKDEIIIVSNSLTSAVNKLRSMSPLYESSCIKN